MTADVHALTGAYVLDAVSAAERDEFERHLRECGTCAQEVRELRETATRLGRAAAVVPPPALRAAVLARIAQVRQDPPEASVTPLRPRRPWALRLTGAAAAVLLVATVTLGVLLVQAREDVDRSTAQAAAMTAILAAGDARISSQGDPAEGRMTVLSSRTADRAVLLAENLPEPPPGRDYQAWTMGAEPRSAGLLPDGGTAALAVEGIDSADRIGITLEPDGGSPLPTGDPVMEFDVT